jgi:hypothetical protein
VKITGEEPIKDYLLVMVQKKRLDRNGGEEPNRDLRSKQKPLKMLGLVGGPGNNYR